MPINRLNHAVLYVRSIDKSVSFYRDVLGFRVVDIAPEGFNGAAFLQAAGSANDHDLGLFEVSDHAESTPTGAPRIGLYHLAWEVDTLNDLEDLAAKLSAAKAFVGATDHGTTKSLYGKDPSGIEFEIAWIVPADLLTVDAIEARKALKRLDLDKERARYGGATQGGLGISRPLVSE